MSSSKYYFLKSLGLSVDTVKHLLNNTVSATTHYNNVSFWMSCNLETISTRSDVLKAHYNITNKIAVNSNKKAHSAQTEKSALQKALDEEKKRNRISTNKYVTTKKIIRFSLYGTGLFHNTLFNSASLENTIIENINKELNHDSARIQYVDFWENVDLHKIYKRTHINTTINNEKKRAYTATLKALAKYPTLTDKVINNQISETTKNYSTLYCRNAFLNIAFNTSLAERIVWSDLFSLYNRTGNKIFYDILYNANTIINKEDITQELKAFLIEKASTNEFYYDSELDEIVFDIVLCFRHINNFIYHHNNRDTYKRIHTDNESAQTIDYGYVDNMLESIDNDFLVCFSDYCYSKGASVKTVHTMQDIIGGILAGYTYRTIGDNLGISDNTIKSLVKRYIKPYLVYNNTYLANA